VDLNRAFAAFLASNQEPRAWAYSQASVPPSMLDLLYEGEQGLLAAEVALTYASTLMRSKAFRAMAVGAGIVRELSAVKLGAPVPRPGKVLCLGLNYRDHAQESGMKLPRDPVIFSKVSSSVIGHGSPIQVPRATKEVDYEVELAFVIGQKCKEVDRRRAYDYIVGYTILNDVSGRDYQLKKDGGQWLLGKSFDTFCPMGPWIVTKDEIRNPHDLDIRLKLSGKVMQHSNTRQLVFRIPDILAYLSRVFTLEPGDVVATGTPGGVGFARKPPVFLKRGDTVRLEVEKIGVLENPVV
jgi:acylpyruvate hydrolase